MSDAEKETDNLRQNTPKSKPLDALDRKILGALTEDATRSYADLGREVGLSAPAVHERVKRLRATGVIKRTRADLHGPSLGKDFQSARFNVITHIGSCIWVLDR